jgi:TctA family transporter
VGAFSLNNSFLDLWVLLLFGVFGYGLRKLAVDSSPLVVALGALALFAPPLIALVRRRRADFHSPVV